MTMEHKKEILDFDGFVLSFDHPTKDAYMLTNLHKIDNPDAVEEGATIAFNTQSNGDIVSDATIIES
jgi:hypothetical protein